MVTSFLDSVAKPIHKMVPLYGTKFTPWNLRALDESYRVMNEYHQRVHEHFIGNLKGKEYRTVLEVACGTGWNVPRFRNAGLQYFGLDISETAVALAAMKFPENQYFNIAVCDCSMYRDGSFDVVYNSAMLEHIGYFEDAILEIVRLAKHQAIILFFEGLSDEPDHKLDFHHWEESELSGKKTNIFGRKLLLQDHRVHDERGWYWNRYSRSKIESFLKRHGLSYTLLDKNNCAVIQEQTVLVISR